MRKIRSRLVIVAVAAALLGVVSLPQEAVSTTVYGHYASAIFSNPVGDGLYVWAVFDPAGMTTHAGVHLETTSSYYDSCSGSVDVGLPGLIVQGIASPVAGPFIVADDLSYASLTVTVPCANSSGSESWNVDMHWGQTGSLGIYYSGGVLNREATGVSHAGSTPYSRGFFETDDARVGFGAIV